MTDPTPTPVTPITGNNLATYAGSLVAGGLFYFLGQHGVTAPAGAEAGIAGLFTAILGQLVGRIMGGK